MYFCLLLNKLCRDLNTKHQLSAEISENRDIRTTCQWPLWRGFFLLEENQLCRALKTKHLLSANIFDNQEF